MKLANIVSTQNVDAPEEFNVVKTIGLVIDGLPTLIVGYDYVNKHYPAFDITNISLAENLYWTFKRTEKRDKYEEDLRWFIHKVYEDQTNQLMYVFVDPIQYSSKTLIKIVRKIYSLKKPIGFLNGDMVYIYADKLIFGVDLKLLKYIGFDIDKIKDKLKRFCSVFLDDDQIIIEYKKNVMLLDNKIRYIPYLYSVRHDQDINVSSIHIPREN